jgi:hypothetical protein
MLGTIPRTRPKAVASPTTFAPRLSETVADRAGEPAECRSGSLTTTSRSRRRNDRIEDRVLVALHAMIIVLQ